jgi:hypothetical protein
MPGVGAAIRMEPRWTGVDRGAPRARKPPGESCRRETPPGNSPDQSRSMPTMTVRIGNANGVVGFPEEHVAEREIERLVSGDRTKSLVPYCDGPYCGKSRVYRVSLQIHAFVDQKHRDLLDATKIAVIREKDVGTRAASGSELDRVEWYRMRGARPRFSSSSRRMGSRSRRPAGRRGDPRSGAGSQPEAAPGRPRPRRRGPAGIRRGRASPRRRR